MQLYDIFYAFTSGQLDYTKYLIIYNRVESRMVGGVGVGGKNNLACTYVYTYIIKVQLSPI
jgi:hypothetical protein